MKCPYCGNKLDEKNVCSRCGKKIDIPKHELEVEYKDFKVSELLEIRKKQKTQTKEVGETALQDRNKQKKSYDPAGVRFENDEKVEIKTQRARPVTKDNKKKTAVTVILMLLALAVITGTYYLLSFLFQQ